MTNHFHVFLKLTEANLSTGMHDLQSGYATYFNKRHQRPGALFEGRFKAIFVESEGHAWSLSRYLHLNPYRALGVKPEHFRWSTYRHFLDPREAPKWLDWRTVLCEFSGTEAAAWIAYRRYVESGLTQKLTSPLDQAYKGVLLGSPSFIAQHRHLIEEAESDVARISQSLSIDAAIRLVGESFAVSEDAIRVRGRHGNLAREVAIWLCREVSRSTLTDIDPAFSRRSPFHPWKVRDHDACE